MQKSHPISFHDIFIVKKSERKKDRPLRALVKKLSKSEDHSESHQNSELIVNFPNSATEDHR